MKINMLKLIFLTLTLLISNSHAQLESDLILEIPTGTQTDIDNVAVPLKGMLVYNTTDNKIYNYNGIQWVNINITVSSDIDNQITVGTDSGVYLSPTVYTGFFIIDSNGQKIITGLPFKPSQITFVGHANIESLNINADNQTNDNNTGISNSFGTMNGFARENSGGTITQQVIYVGGSGNSINDISRYASSSHCIGIRYSNQNGNNLGVLNAALDSFNSNGFVIDVNRTSNAINENLVVLYTAYK